MRYLTFLLLGMMMILAGMGCGGTPALKPPTDEEIRKSQEEMKLVDIEESGPEQPKKAKSKGRIKPTKTPSSQKDNKSTGTTKQ